MKRFEIYARYSTDKYVGEVFADSEDEAVEKAEGTVLLDLEGVLTVCSHCSHITGEIQFDELFVEEMRCAEK